jgi:hypothetical protein
MEATESQRVADMSANNPTIVLTHGAWADGSSWSKVISQLGARGIKSAAVPLPLTSLSDDVAALDRTADRVGLHQHQGRTPALAGPAELVSAGRGGPHDRPRHAAFHG